MPAFLFTEDEYEDLVSFVTLGVLFLWDVHVVSTGARQLLFYSHDEVGWTGPNVSNGTVSPITPVTQ